MEFTERMEAGRDAAAAKRHRGLVTGKSAAGWNAKPRYDDEGTWHATLYVTRQRWDSAKHDAHASYERMVFPERDFDPFNPNAPTLTLETKWGASRQARAPITAATRNREVNRGTR
jgi:hypothetical protein